MTTPGWTRRRFLQAVGAGVLAGPALELLRVEVPHVAGAPIGPTDGVLVVIVLYGGNDGLNTFVPYGDGLYYSRRPNLAAGRAESRFCSASPRRYPPASAARRSVP